MVASASTLIARPRRRSGTSSCIAVLEEANPQTQKTPPTASAAPATTGERALAYVIAQSENASSESGMR